MAELSDLELLAELGGRLGSRRDLLGLRRRFEYYLLGLGEVSAADIRTLVNDEARRANGEELGDAIMAIWDKYWSLRTHEWRNAFVQSDRNTWMPAFEEQRMVRRQILGEDWLPTYVAQANEGGIERVLV